MHFLTVDLTIANSLMCFQTKGYLEFFWLANILYSLAEILVKMEQLKFSGTVCMPIND